MKLNMKLIKKKLHQYCLDHFDHLSLQWYVDFNVPHINTFNWVETVLRHHRFTSESISETTKENIHGKANGEVTTRPKIRRGLE